MENNNSKIQQCEGLRIYCSDKLKLCSKYLPSRYSKQVVENAKQMGITVTRQFVIDVRTERKFDKVIVDLLVDLSKENEQAILRPTE